MIMFKAIDEIFDYCGQAYDIEVSQIKPLQTILATPEKDIVMLKASLFFNEEETVAAYEQVRADLDADQWFMAGLDTADLVSVVATQMEKVRY